MGLTRNLPAQFGMNMDPKTRLYIPAASGGGFFISPIRVVDFTAEIIVPRLGGAADSLIRHRGGSATVGTRGLLQVSNASASFVSAPDQPQWHEDTGTSPAENDAANWAVALINIDFIQGVDITQFRNPVGVQPTLGQYFDLNVFQRDWTMFGVPNNTPGVREADLTFRYADRATKTDVRGEHTIKLRFERQ